MAAITIATVGYGEIVPITGNSAATSFTIFLMFSSMGIIMMLTATFTAFILEGELKNIMWQRKIRKMTAKLENHFIICGYGNTGEHIVDEMIATQRPFIVIEKNPERIALLQSRNILALERDVLLDETLIEVGIQRAAGLVTTLGADKDNLLIVISARELNPKLRIISRGIEAHIHPKLKKAGADSVISSNKIGGLRMVSELVRPHVVTFLDKMLRTKNEKGDSVRIDEIAFKRESNFINKTLGDTNICKQHSIQVLAYYHAKDAAFHYNPPSDLKIEQDMVLVVLGGTSDINALRQIASPS